MAFDLSGLASYTKENQDELVTRSLFDAKTQKLIQSEGTVMADIKSAEQINQLDTDAVFQAGGTCGFTPSGTTAYTRRSLTVGKLKVHERLCPKDLESKYTQLLLKPGSRPQEIIFEKVYSELKAGVIAEQLETAIWQGDTNSANVNLNKFDGFIKLIDAAKGVVGSNVFVGSGTATSTTGSTAFTGTGTFFTKEVSVGDKIYNNAGTLIGTVASITSDTAIVLTANGAVAITGASYEVFSAKAQAASGNANPILVSAGITEANVRSIVKGVWKSLPAKVKGKKDVRIVCGYDVFESYIGALIEANLFAYTAGNEAQASGEIVIPGTQYKLTAVHGLDGTNRIYGVRMSNLYLGCDILGEEDKFEIFYAKEADEVRFVTEFKMGCQFLLGNEIVSYLGA